MSNNNPVHVKAHTRDGKHVKSHFRNVGKRINRLFSGRKDKVEIRDVEDVPILEVAPEVYDEIKAKVDKPLLILARANLDQEKLERLVNNGGVDKGGNAVIRNRGNGDVMKINLIDLSAVR